MKIETIKKIEESIETIKTLLTDNESEDISFKIDDIENKIDDIENQISELSDKIDDITDNLDDKIIDAIKELLKSL